MPHRYLPIGFTSPLLRSYSAATQASIMTAPSLAPATPTLRAMELSIRPTMAWKGRVVNALGEPLDHQGPLPQGTSAYPIQHPPLRAHERVCIGPKLDVGVRAINSFLTCCAGQRLGIFHEPGVETSRLLAMLARYARTQVTVIGFIGAQPHEVQAFIQDYLGEEGLQRAIIVVATCEEAPLMRRQAAYLTLTLCDYFRTQDQHVLCLMDSITEVARAQREIGLAHGEPPVHIGYPPSVFTLLPHILERTGPGSRSTSPITAFFTVVVERDHYHDPILDTLRGTFDGHIVLDRAMVERHRFPAINVLRSMSRSMPGCNTDEENTLIYRARVLMTIYDDMAELIRIGVYQKGSDPEMDQAIAYHAALEQFLAQDIHTPCSLEEGYRMLTNILEWYQFQN